MFSSSTSSSSTSGFGSPLSFGQASNSNASSTIPFGGQNSSKNICGLPSTSVGGNSMGLFGSMQATPSSPIAWGSSSDSMTSSTNGFGSQVGFGQSINPSTGSSGSQYTFGQGSNLFGSASNNGGTSTGVFGGSLFGQSSNLFGSASNNGGTSTGVFGQTASSTSFGQGNNTFGIASSNGGTSMSVFGQKASSSLFGQGNNIFGSAPKNSGTSTGVFGQKASSCLFGQSNNIFGSAPFGQTVSNSSFGQNSNIFGSVPNDGGTSTGIFGQTASSSSFGQSSNIFGSVHNNSGTSAGVFGQAASSSSFGQRNNIFGSLPNNGKTSNSPFEFQHTLGSVPASGGTSKNVFGVTVSPFSSAPMAISSSPILWSSSTGSTTSSQVPAAIVSSSSGFNSGCVTSSGQTTVPWVSSSLSGTNTFSFGTQSSFSGNQVKAPNFGPSDNSSFGEKRGSRVTSYTKTTTVVEKGERNTFVSISAMPSYQNKSHEELRWEDHHQYNAGGGGVVPASVQSNDFSNPFGRTDRTFPSPIPHSVPSNPFSTMVTPSIGQYSFLNPAPPSVPSNPLASAVTPPSTGQYSFFNPVPPAVSSNPFFTTVTTPSVSAAQSFPASFKPLISPNSCDMPSISVNQPVSISEPNKSPFRLNIPTPTAPQFPSINSSSAGAASIVGPNYTTSFASSPYMCSTVTAPVTISVPCTAAAETASWLSPFWPSQTSQTRGLSLSGYDGFKGVGEQTTIVQQLPSQNTEIKQSPIANPFGTPSAVPQMLTEETRTAPPARYGISSIPVCDKPAPSKSPSLLNIRHLSCHRQRRLPIQKYKPKSDGPKVAFFDDAQKTPTTAKKEAPLLPRSNPRAFISGIHEELDLRVKFNNTSFEKNTSTDTYENGKVELSAPDHDGSLYQDKDGISSETVAAKHNRNTDSVHGDHSIRKEISLNVYEMMPKLKHSDYFFEPGVEEMAMKESYEPGFCSHVKGFVVGRQGYGSIKFLEETDVRELDLESYIEFRNREVVVYMDESKKPPVGQGLNKAAEITLCNIKLVDKRTGKQYVNGPNVDKFKEKLMKKTAEQGAEFVSYNPVQGEWKFRVQHF